MERVYATRFASPIGPLQIASTERGVCALMLPRSSWDDLLAWLDRHLPGCEVAVDAAPNRVALSELREYFAGQRRSFDLPLDLRGTPFQRRVWQELAAIPYGETRSYQDIAARLGNPRASRAVGMANHANPVGIVIPCHRVIAKDGSLGGYGGGLDIKTHLLRLEGVALGE